jgi:hypothetical protein
MRRHLEHRTGCLCREIQELQPLGTLQFPRPAAAGRGLGRGARLRFCPTFKPIIPIPSPRGSGERVRERGSLAILPNIQTDHSDPLAPRQRGEG